MERVRELITQPILNNAILLHSIGYHVKPGKQLLTAAECAAHIVSRNTDVYRLATKMRPLDGKPNQLKKHPIVPLIMKVLKDAVPGAVVCHEQIKPTPKAQVRDLFNKAAAADLSPGMVAKKGCNDIAGSQVVALVQVWALASKMQLSAVPSVTSPPPPRNPPHAPCPNAVD